MRWDSEYERYVDYGPNLKYGEKIWPDYKIDRVAETSRAPRALVWAFNIIYWPCFLGGCLFTCFMMWRCLS